MLNNLPHIEQKMAGTIITYESIYEKLRKEKYEPELQKLPESFFKEVIDYLKEKQAIGETQKSQQSMFPSEAAKTEKQIENVKKILKELYERRESKIIQLALYSSRTKTPIDTSSLLPEELSMYKDLLNKFNFYRSGVLKNLLELNLPVVDKHKDIKTQDQEKTKLVCFLNSVPKFMGEDLNIYGPFIEQDVASLPPRVASLLIKKKRAQEIKQS